MFSLESLGVHAIDHVSLPADEQELMKNLLPYAG